MLLQRIISSIILIPALLLILFYAPLSVFVLTIAVIAALGIYEFIKMAENKNIKINPYITYGVMIFFIGIAWAEVFYGNNSSGKQYCFLPLVITILASLIQLKQIKDNKVNNKTLFIDCLFVQFYIVLPLLHAVFLYKTDVFLVLMVLLITWANDTGAYFVGKAFGKHKLAPTVSPGKTIEGSVAGLLAGTATIIVFKYIDKIQYLQNVSYVEIFIGGIIISIAGQAGDLYESYIKRAFDVKDSGNLIPGHGGILDRIDSLLFAFPITFYCFMLLEFIKG